MTLPTRQDQFDVVPGDAVRERGGILSFFSSQERRGAWEVPRHLRIACCMGSVEVDLREARLAEGETIIETKILLGSVELLLPPGVTVEMEGDALMGSYTFKPDPTAVPLPGAPRIILRGSAILGSMEAESRYAGESRRAADRRIKAAQKLLGKG